MPRECVAGTMRLHYRENNFDEQGLKLNVEKFE